MKNDGEKLVAYGILNIGVIGFHTKDHSNVSSAEWTSVPTLMHGLQARLAETLMSTGDQSCTRIFTIEQTHFLVDCRRRMPLLRVQTLLQHPVLIA